MPLSSSSSSSSSSSGTHSSDNSAALRKYLQGQQERALQAQEAQRIREKERTTILGQHAMSSNNSLPSRESTNASKPSSFTGLFERAGLDDDDDQTFPSRASTSGSDSLRDGQPTKKKKASPDSKGSSTIDDSTNDDNHPSRTTSTVPTAKKLTPLEKSQAFANMANRARQEPDDDPQLQPSSSSSSIPPSPLAVVVSKSSSGSNSGVPSPTQNSEVEESDNMSSTVPSRRSLTTNTETSSSSETDSVKRQRLFEDARAGGTTPAEEPLPAAVAAPSTAAAAPLPHVKEDDENESEPVAVVPPPPTTPSFLDRELAKLEQASSPKQETIHSPASSTTRSSSVSGGLSSSSGSTGSRSGTGSRSDTGSGSRSDSRSRSGSDSRSGSRRQSGSDSRGSGSRSSGSRSGSRSGSSSGSESRSSRSGSYSSRTSSREEEQRPRAVVAAPAPPPESSSPMQHSNRSVARSSRAAGSIQQQESPTRSSHQQDSVQQQQYPHQQLQAAAPNTPSAASRSSIRSGSKSHSTNNDSKSKSSTSSSKRSVQFLSPVESSVHSISRPPSYSSSLPRIPVTALPSPPIVQSPLSKTATPPRPESPPSSDSEIVINVGYRPQQLSPKEENRNVTDLQFDSSNASSMSQSRRSSQGSVLQLMEQRRKQEAEKEESLQNSKQSLLAPSSPNDGDSAATGSSRKDDRIILEQSKTSQLSNDDIAAAPKDSPAARSTEQSPLQLLEKQRRDEMERTSQAMMKKDITPPIAMTQSPVHSTKNEIEKPVSPPIAMTQSPVHSTKNEIEKPVSPAAATSEVQQEIIALPSPTVPAVEVISPAGSHDVRTRGGVKPPALTTYAETEKLLSLPQSPPPMKDHPDPPSELVAQQSAAQPAAAVSKNLREEEMEERNGWVESLYRAKKEKERKERKKRRKLDENAPPPMQVVSVSPPSDDDSTLGSMGHLFRPTAKGVAKASSAATKIVPTHTNAIPPSESILELRTPQQDKQVVLPVTSAPSMPEPLIQESQSPRSAVLSENLVSSSWKHQSPQQEMEPSRPTVSPQSPVPQKQTQESPTMKKVEPRSEDIEQFKQALTRGILPSEDLHAQEQEKSEKPSAHPTIPPQKPAPVSLDPSPQKHTRPMRIENNHKLVEIGGDPLYYKSWIVPTPLPTRDRHAAPQDPPAPRSTFVPNLAALRRTAPYSKSEQEEPVHQHVDDVDYEQKDDSDTADEGRWVPLSAMPKMRQVSTFSFETYKARSDDNNSAGSDWAPPNGMKAYKHAAPAHVRAIPVGVSGKDEIELRPNSRKSVSSGSFDWMPKPSTTRVDFTGALNQTVPNGQSHRVSRNGLVEGPTSVGEDGDSSDSRSSESSGSNESSERGEEDTRLQIVSPAVTLNRQQRQRRNQLGVAQPENTTNTTVDDAGVPRLGEMNQSAMLAAQQRKHAAYNAKPLSTTAAAVPRPGETNQSATLVAQQRKHAAYNANAEPLSTTASSQQQHPLPHNQNIPPHARGKKVSPSIAQQPHSSQVRSSKDQEYDDRTRELKRRQRKGAALFFLIFIPVLLVGAILAIVLTRRRSRNKTNPPIIPTGPSEEVGDLRELVLAVAPGSAANLENPSSAQSRSLQWLTADDSLDSYSRTQALQRYVLGVVYFSTNGLNWNNGDMWVSESNECDWYSAETDNPICDSNRRLTEIDLSRNNLNGKIPWTDLNILGPQLSTLELGNNTLTDSIATTIGNLASLNVIDLQGNSFIGTIPTHIGRLRRTTSVDFSNNSLFGTIPSELSFMVGLQSLRLSGNQFTGTIPSELAELESLERLYLSGNSFEGPVPEEICALGLTVLEVDCVQNQCSCCTSCVDPVTPVTPITPDGPVTPTGPAIPIDQSDPSYSLITGAFPEAADALADPSSPQSFAFRWLQTAANSGIDTNSKLIQRYALASFYYAMNGDAWFRNDQWLSSADECTWFTTLDTGSICDANGIVKEIVLKENNLRGTLPLELVFVSNSLASLDLRGNAISGSIPQAYSNLNNLENFILSSNDLFGVIPSEIGQMTKLERLMLLENNLFSTIPSEIGLLTNLEMLDLGGNQLTGTLPSTIGKIPTLAGLSLFSNFLSGTLPAELANLQNLQLLYLDKNDIQGSLPSDLCSLRFAEFWSDCNEISCTCCTTCCIDGTGCT